MSRTAITTNSGVRAHKQDSPQIKRTIYKRVTDTIRVIDLLIQLLFPAPAKEWHHSCLKSHLRVASIGEQLTDVMATLSMSEPQIKLRLGMRL